MQSRKIHDALRRGAGVASLALGLIACSDPADGRRPGFEASRADGAFGGGDRPEAGAADGCSDASKFVYVLSEQNKLHRFVPGELSFAEVGTLNCAANGATPNSMAVDRSGTAWVNFSDGHLFKVSTRDASCVPTAFEPGQHGFVRFGMAFATNGAGSTEETLYVSGGIDGAAGIGLAAIDVASLELRPIGDYDGPLARTTAELTGTGDGKLYGFFTTSPTATFAEIDTATAATSNRMELSGVSTGRAWAFSFWGGDFWFYTSPGAVPSSITRLAASGDGTTVKVKDSVGDVGRIVGAGVSTCAPTTPPK